MKMKEFVWGEGRPQQTSRVYHAHSTYTVSRIGPHRLTDKNTEEIIYLHTIVGEFSFPET